MTKHKHAELMKLYAEDAMETDKPWERWQFTSMSGQWIDYESEGPLWLEKSEYRRKPVITDQQLWEAFTEALWDKSGVTIDNYRDVFESAIDGIALERPGPWKVKMSMFQDTLYKALRAVNELRAETPDET